MLLRVGRLPAVLRRWRMAIVLRVVVVDVGRQRRVRWRLMVMVLVVVLPPLLRMERKGGGRHMSPRGLHVVIHVFPPRSAGRLQCFTAGLPTEVEVERESSSFLPTSSSSSLSGGQRGGSVVRSRIFPWLAVERRGSCWNLCSGLLGAAADAIHQRLHAKLNERPPAVAKAREECCEQRRGWYSWVR